MNATDISEFPPDRQDIIRRVLAVILAPWPMWKKERLPDWHLIMDLSPHERACMHHILIETVRTGKFDSVFKEARRFHWYK
jgi:hypothetical protein